jgi:hydrophobic/amphiphilic exporter-1 (mainly G- bacteria), HAE1 family
VVEVVNQAPETNRAVSELARDALLGVVLAILVILAFLRTVRGTLVAGVSIPLSLLIGFIVMGSQGITLNILTLGALSVAAARVIDDSIVVLENIHRLLEEGVERGEAVVRGTSQMGPAITASTITTVAVFLPLAFVGGIVGEVFVGFALTITFALLASLLVAVTVVPVLAQTFLRLSDDRKGDAAEQALASRYRRPLAWALDHRAVVVIAAVALLIGSMTAARSIPTNLFPSLQAEVLQVDIALPPGTSLAATSEAVAGLERELAAIAGIEQYTTVVGTSPNAASSVTGGGGGGSNSARLTIDLADGADTGRVETALEAALETAALRGTVTEAAGAGPGGSQLTVQVTGREFTAVADGAAGVAAALQTIEGLEAITSNVASARPELVAEVNAQAAAARGLDGTEVAALLRAALNPTPATTVRVDGEELQVVVAVDPSAVAAPDDLATLPLAPGVNLGDVASLRQGESPTGVTTYDGSRSAEVSATIVSNNIGAVTTDVENALDQLDLAGAEASLGGASEMMRDSFSSLLVAMLIAVALVYLAMVAAFGSLLTPFVILFSLPLAAVGAFPALLVTGRELGLPAMIGLLMLIGIVVTNAIVMLEFVERLKREGLPTRDALLVGAQTRLRPILMTAIVTVTALIPLALGLSEGAVLSSSLATVVIGGMLSATLLTLFVVPVAYSLVDGLRRRTGGGVAAPAADRPDPMLVGT